MLKLRYVIFIIFFSFCSREVIIVEESKDFEITAPVFTSRIQSEININSYSSSFWKKDEKNQLVQENGKYVDQQGSYKRENTFLNSDTLFLIMDPWTDMDSEFLNNRHKKIVKNSIRPLVDLLVENDFNVIVFTNDCERRERSFNCDIGTLQEYVDEGKISKFYHDDWVSSTYFNEFLKINKISNLVYLGFNSNQCIINRHVGMIPLRLVNGNINLFIIPEASAAIEYADDWDSDIAHKSTLDLISSWLGELIYLEDLLDEL